MSYQALDEEKEESDNGDTITGLAVEMGPLRRPVSRQKSSIRLSLLAELNSEEIETLVDAIVAFLVDMCLKDEHQRLRLYSDNVEQVVEMLRESQQDLHTFYMESALYVDPSSPANQPNPFHDLIAVANKILEMNDELNQQVMIHSELLAAMKKDGRFEADQPDFKDFVLKPYKGDIYAGIERDALCGGCRNPLSIDELGPHHPIYRCDASRDSDTYVFFHSQSCVELRKYKECIREIAAKHELTALSEKNQRTYEYHGVEDYIRLLSDELAEKSIIVDGCELTKPLPAKEVQDKFEFATGRWQEDASSNVSRPEQHSDVIPSLILISKTFDECLRQIGPIRHKRKLAALLLRRARASDSVGPWYELESPLMKNFDFYQFGEPLFLHLREILSSKSREEIWVILKHVVAELPTAVAFQLITEDKQLMDSKTEMLDALFLGIIEASIFPVATALLLAAFLRKAGEQDLSREETFQELSDKYVEIASNLVDQIESNHLLAIFLEIPTVFDKNVLEIALENRMADFLDHSRLMLISTQMWSQVRYLEPNKPFVAADPNLFESYKCLVMTPNQFYFTPLGRFVIEVVFYCVYLALVSRVVYQGIRPGKHVSQLEWLMWIFNAGHVIFEVDQFFSGPRVYFSTFSNWWDSCSSMLWVMLALLRRDGGTDVSGRKDLIDYFYIGLSLQLLLLWTRLVTFLTRSQKIGPMIRMIRNMIKDIFYFFIISSTFLIGFTLAYEELTKDSNKFNGLPSSMRYVIQTLLGQQEWSQSDSTDNFSRTRARAFDFLIVGWSIIGNVILLNLLIAIMASSYENVREQSKREVNFSRIKLTYTTVQEGFVAPPPLNLAAAVVMAVWVFVLETIVKLFSCCRYHLNVEWIFPISVDYMKREDSQMTTCFSRMTNTGNTCRRNFVDVYCRYCKQRIDREQNANEVIDEYLTLFTEYRFDSDDRQLMKRLLRFSKNAGLCHHCFRPYQDSQGLSSSVLFRYKVVMEIVSFYAFMIVGYIPMVIAMLVPAGIIWLSKKLAKQGIFKFLIKEENDDKVVVFFDETYRGYVRKAVQEEETQEEVLNKMRAKLDNMSASIGIRDSKEQTSKEDDKEPFTFVSKYVFHNDEAGSGPLENSVFSEVKTLRTQLTELKEQQKKQDEKMEMMQKYLSAILEKTNPDDFGRLEDEREFGGN